MSTLYQPDAHDPNSLLYYAPRRLRDRDAALRRPRPGESRQSTRWTFLEQLAEGDASPANALPEVFQRTSDLQPIEPPDLVHQRARRREAFALIARFAAVGGIAAMIALLYVMNFPASRGRPLSAEDHVASPAPQSRKAAADPSPQQVAALKIAVEDGEGDINEPLPLGVNVADQTPGATVNLSGLPADAKLTTGVAAGPGEWRVAVSDLPVTVVVPPRDYVGQMNVVAELPGGKGGSTLRNVVRLNWRQIPLPSAVTVANASPAAGAAAAQTARQMDPKEIAGLMKRGEDLALAGDMPAARLLLQRAAEAHNARAAFELAATYDPIVTKQLGSNGPKPDLALARAWYQKAREWGSPDAQKQLEALAGAD